MADWCLGLLTPRTALLVPRSVAPGIRGPLSHSTYPTTNPMEGRTMCDNCLLGALSYRGVLVNVSVCYWRVAQTRWLPSRRSDLPRQSVHLRDTPRAIIVPAATVPNVPLYSPTTNPRSDGTCQQPSRSSPYQRGYKGGATRGRGV